MRYQSRKSLLLTFDYELFLGARSGTPRECLLEPTDSLLKIFSRYPLRAIFFVDTLYLLELKERAGTVEQCRSDFDSICTQLRQLARAGHELFLHLHPHWLGAEYLPETNQWRLGGPELYRLHAHGEQTRRQMFAESLALLEGIVRSAGRTKPLDAYRAGGWSIQPFDVFAPLFREFGIRYDFSVAPPRWSFTEAHWFDFTAVQEARGPYRFSEDVVRPDAGGEFVECPISYLHTGTWSRRLDKLLRMTIGHRLVGTRGKGEILQAKALAYEEGRYPDLYFLQLASPENFRTPFMPEYFRFARDNDYLHFIAHPKLLTAENLFWLGRLLAYLYKNFSVESDYRRIADA